MSDWARCVALDTFGAPFGRRDLWSKLTALGLLTFPPLRRDSFGKTEFEAAGRQVYWEECRVSFVAS